MNIGAEEIFHSYHSFAVNCVTKLLEENVISITSAICCLEQAVLVKVSQWYYKVY